MGFSAKLAPVKSPFFSYMESNGEICVCSFAIITFLFMRMTFNLGDVHINIEHFLFSYRKESMKIRIDFHEI